MKKKLKIVYKIMIALVMLLAIVVGGFYIYTLDYYRASDEVQLLLNEKNNIQVKEDYVIVYPEASLDLQKGLIFYPAKMFITAFPLLNQMNILSG